MRRVGAVIVDLPGAHDSNAARANVAKQYLQKCDAVWILAPITRAVDDNTAKDLIGETFKRQLLMDGQYSAVTFICSTTDVSCSGYKLIWTMVLTSLIGYLAFRNHSNTRSSGADRSKLMQKSQGYRE